MIPAPPIDSRTASDIEQQLRALLSTYAPTWKGAGVAGDFGDALVRIFARYAEIVIERLNRTPEKNLLAYLDLLGVSRLPPQPARVPLTFSLAAGSTADAVVPAATQVAAPPAAGDTAPPIFETERELTVVAASLDKVFVREVFFDRDNNKWTRYRSADLSNLCSASGSDARCAFTGTEEMEHSLYLGIDDLLGRAGLSKLHLQFEVTSHSPSLDPRKLRWSIVDGEGGKEMPLTADAGLAQPGQVSFSFSNLPAVPHRMVNNQRSRWLRGQLATPIAPGDKAPDVSNLTVSADLSRQGVPVALAFANTTLLDVTKDFLPFGERPRLGDALCLSAGDAFGMAKAVVTLKFQASSPPPTAPPSPRVPTLKWESWDGGHWAELAPINDGTAALTKTGEVKFTLGTHPAMLTISGVEGFWVRVRIWAGNYGEDAKYEPVPPKKPTNQAAHEGAEKNDPPAESYRYIPPSLAPPSIATITADYAATLQDQRPDRIVTSNDFAYAVVERLPFLAFHRTADTRPTLYLGFALPDTRSFPNRPVALYFDIAEPDSRTKLDVPSPAAPPRFVWECWEGADGWRRPGLRDGTRGLTRPGVIEFLAPAGFALQQEFGAKRYWLRCRWETGEFAFEPRLQRVLLNTVMAEHATTILDETLGSSDGSQSQRYLTTRRPVLRDQEELRVREPDLPSAEERAALEVVWGDDAIAVTRDASGRPIEVWVRWKEVPDFYGSGPRNRHYVLDHVTGTISFGDGVNGLVPPPGAGNLRLARYRTGGGSAGNCAAGTIVQLKTTVPYVDKVTNPEPARGGADAETMGSLRERGPRAIRHRGRAVTIEDYEDLAILASPEVARVKCVPLYDLSTDPEAKKPKLPGVVSVIVVPRSTQAKPFPSRVLLERVASYLDAGRLPVVDLKVVGPDYVEIDIGAEVALTSIDRASEVQPRIVDSLRRFLHPLTGGFDGSGWDFGRSPQKSDLLWRIGEIAGVDHVRSLSLKVPETPVPRTALVSAGKLDIAVAAINA